MNNKRKKELKDAAERIESVITMIECAKDEEQSAYDNLPENFQDSERGEEMVEIIDALEDIVASLNDVLEEYQGVLEDIG